MKKVCCSIMLLLLLYLPTQVCAHESRPIYLELTEVEQNVFVMTYKAPKGGVVRGQISPKLPSNCVAVNSDETQFIHAAVERKVLRCPKGITSESVSIANLENNFGLSALVRVSLLSGAKFSKIITNTNPEFVIPEKEDRLAVLKSYFILGG